ncbi:hypothetical protein AMTR_s00128p00102650 [Amborella trichopoda]|uniref:Uncharacterized protein n=1 Tax=Amborella trichopoda TaxID=13333 RepID=W1NLV5_AMBTC|nr:hypothetical protein AMTR_s00128p00102650 [Amborella trichopoda]
MAILRLKDERGKLTMHIQIFSAMIRELEAVDIKADKKMQVCYLLNTIPSSWEAFISVLTTQESMPKLDGIITKLKAEEERRMTHDTPTTNDSMNLVNLKPNSSFIRKKERQGQEQK